MFGPPLRRWTGLRTCHVLVSLPPGFISDFLKPCTALERFSSVDVCRRMLAMSPATFPCLHSIQIELGHQMPMVGPLLPLKIHLEAFQFHITHFYIRDRGNDGPFGESSCADLLLNLQAPRTLRTIALVHFAPRQQLLTFLSRHWDQFTNVAVSVDLFGNFREHRPQNTRSFCLPSILDFLQSGNVPETCFRRDLKISDTGRSLSYSICLEGFSYVKDQRTIDGEPTHLRALGLACFSMDEDYAPPTVYFSVPALFSEVLRLCQRFPEVQELNIQLTNTFMKDPLALPLIIVSFLGTCFISRLTFC